MQSLYILILCVVIDTIREVLGDQFDEKEAIEALQLNKMDVQATVIYLLGKGIYVCSFLLL